MATRSARNAVAIMAACLVLDACVYRIDRTVVPTFDRVRRDVKYLKVHMRNGDAYVLDTWSLDPSGTVLVGSGEHRGPDRSLLADPSPYRIALGEIAVYETDAKTDSPSNGLMEVLTVLSVTFSVLVIGAFVALSQERT